jgi:phosphoenolpyruvate-protein kinase (PTS system EI component)
MAQPDLSWLPSREEQVAHYRELRRNADDPEVRWILLLKELRVEHGCSILEAERMALSDPALRKWAEKQINTQPHCRKMAIYHMRSNGEASLIERDGDTLKIRIPAT